jgi:predicted porin
MKKHLIAAAVAGAFAVPAMAQVTISGSLDYAVLGNGKVTSSTSNTSGNSATKSSSTASLNQWTTNQVVISGTEDLGGGLSAGFTINSHVNGGSGLGSRDTNVFLSGGFGTVRVGRFVPAAGNGFHGFSGAASTAVGSIYHVNAASPTSVRFGTFSAGNMERNDNQVQYTSPSISGLTINANYGTSSSDTDATAGKAETSQQGFTLAYAAGPLSLGAGMTDRSVKTESNAANQDGTLTYFGAAYDLGMAKITFVNVSREDETTAAGVKTKGADLSINSFGVSVPMGAMTLAASMYQGDNDLAGATSDTELSGYQASVRYALSKRTTVYALIGENTIKRDGAASTTGARKETGNMIGLLHTF